MANQTRQEESIKLKLCYYKRSKKYLSHQRYPFKSIYLLSSLLLLLSRLSCPTLCDPIDGSPPGSPLPGILQARTLEWVAISFSNAWKWKVKVKSLSHVRPSETPKATKEQWRWPLCFSVGLGARVRAILYWTTNLQGAHLTLWLSTLFLCIIQWSK